MAHSRAKQGSFKASSSNSGKNNKKLSSNPIASRKKSTKAQQQSTSRSAKGQAGKPIPDQKPVFHNKYICCIGDITNCDGKKFDYDDIGRWVKLHAGVLQKAVDDQTTHVITSIDFYEANLKKPYEERNDMLKQAWRLGRRRCKIVVFDWLEDCLTPPKKSQKRLLPARAYTLDRVLLRIAAGKDYASAEYRKRFEEGVRACHELVDNSKYMIYYDNTGFEYKSILSRVTLGEKISAEKYTLYLFESIAGPPRTYMVGAKLHRAHKPTTLWREWCHPMNFENAFSHFKAFFYKKTGVTWECRLEPTLPSQTRVFTQSFVGNQELEMEEPAKFKYVAPDRGRPLGLLPWGYTLPWDRSGYVEKIKAGDKRKEDETGESSEGDSSGGEVDHGNAAVVAGAYDSDSEVESEDEESEDDARQRQGKMITPPKSGEPSSGSDEDEHDEEEESQTETETETETETGDGSETKREDDSGMEEYSQGIGYSQRLGEESLSFRQEGHSQDIFFSQSAYSRSGSSQDQYYSSQRTTTTTNNNNNTPSQQQQQYYSQAGSSQGRNSNNNQSSIQNKKGSFQKNAILISSDSEESD